MKKTDILVLGGGFGGVNVIRQLKRFKGSITLVDRTNHHLFQPLLYQVATSELVGNDIGTPLREIFKSQKNTHVILDTVTGIDREKKTVTLANEPPIHYKKLVIALGARHSYFGHPEWESFAPGLKSLNDAQNIHDRILASFEAAEICLSEKEKQKHLNFVVVGGGPTGVELAGALAEMTYSTLARSYGNFDIRKANIYLIQGNQYILPSFHPKLCKKSEKLLSKLGVKVLTKHHVSKIEPGKVYTEDMTIETHNIFWAAGVAASPLLRQLETELDKQGRAVVRKDLSLPGDPNVFVIGDSAHFSTGENSSLPGVAPVAIQQGRYLGKVLKKSIPAKKRKPFRYFDKGSMATIGKLNAICETKNLRCTGLIGWFMWAFIHLLFLISFKNRFFVFLRWSMYFIAGLRGARLIAKPIDEVYDQCGFDIFSNGKKSK